jgi:hypothetical protein
MPKNDVNCHIHNYTTNWSGNLNKNGNMHIAKRSRNTVMNSANPVIKNT